MTRTRNSLIPLRRSQPPTDNNRAPPRRRPTRFDATTPDGYDCWGLRTSTGSNQGTRSPTGSDSQKRWEHTSSKDKYEGHDKAKRAGDQGAPQNKKTSDTGKQAPPNWIQEGIESLSENLADVVQEAQELRDQLSDVKEDLAAKLKHRAKLRKHVKDCEKRVLSLIEAGATRNLTHQETKDFIACVRVTGWTNEMMDTFKQTAGFTGMGYDNKPYLCHIDEAKTQRIWGPVRNALMKAFELSDPPNYHGETHHHYLAIEQMRQIQASPPPDSVDAELKKLDREIEDLFEQISRIGKKAKKYDKKLKKIEKEVKDLRDALQHYPGALKQEMGVLSAELNKAMNESDRLVGDNGEITQLLKAIEDYEEALEYYGKGCTPEQREEHQRAIEKSENALISRCTASP